MLFYIAILIAIIVLIWSGNQENYTNLASPESYVKIPTYEPTFSNNWLYYNSDRINNGFLAPYFYDSIYPYFYNNYYPYNNYNYY